MKGWIEIDDKDGNQASININNIEHFSKNYIIGVASTRFELKASYKEIKQLIKEAQC